MARRDMIIDGRGNMADLVRSFDSLIKSVGKLEKRLDDTQKQARKSADAVSNISREIKNFAKGLVSFYGVRGVVGIFKQATSAAIDFQKELRNVSTLLKESGQAVEGSFGPAIRDLAKETGQTTKDLNKALFDTISAGVKGTETMAGAMEFMSVSAKAAIAGNTDVAVSTDALTSILNSFGATAVDTQKFANELFIAAREGKTTFAELAGNVGKVAAIANTAGLEFKEVGSALVGLTRAGLNTAEATTALRSLIVQLLKPSEELEQLFWKVTKSSPAQALGELGLGGVLKILRSNTDGTAESFSKLIPETRGLAAATALTDSQFQAFSDTMELMVTDSNAMGDAFGKMSDTTAHSISVLKASINDLSISIGNALKPAIDVAVSGLISFTNAANNSLNAVKNLINEINEFQKSRQLFRDLVTGELFKEIQAQFGAEMAGPRAPEGVLKKRAKKKMAKRSTPQFVQKLQEKIAAANEAAIMKLHQLRISLLEGEAKIKKQLELDVMRVIKQKHVDEEIKAAQIAALRKKAEKDIADFKDKQTEKEIRDTEKWLRERLKREKEIEESAKGFFKYKVRTEAEIEDLKYDFLERQLQAEKQRREEWIQLFKDIAAGIVDAFHAADDVLGGLFSNLKNQIMEIIQLAVQFAAEGYSVDDAGNIETPLNRLTGVLDQFVSFWENVAANLGDTLSFVTDVAVPKIINAFIENFPKIVQALNENFKRALPNLISLIIDLVIAVLDELPSIVEAIIQGIFMAIERLVQRLPELIAAIQRAVAGIVKVVIQMVIEGIPRIVSEILKAIPRIIKEIVVSLFNDLIPAIAEGVWNGLKGAVSDTDTILTIATGGISSLFHEGGIVGGQVGLGASDVPIIAQMGEAILNREATERLGERGVQAINDGAKVGGDTHINNVVRIDNAFARDINSFVDEMVSDGLKSHQSKTSQVITGPERVGLKIRR